eukprot:531237_1
MKHRHTHKTFVVFVLMWLWLLISIGIYCEAMQTILKDTIDEDKAQLVSDTIKKYKNREAVYLWNVTCREAECDMAAKPDSGDTALAITKEMLKIIPLHLI